MERKAKQSYRIGFTSDLQVVGYDPEGADMDRPNGEIIREVWYALAEDAQGNRWRWGAQRSEQAIERAYVLTAPPVAFWEPTYPAYGSRAYEAYGEADAIAAEARQQDDEAWGFDTRFTRYH